MLNETPKKPVRDFLEEHKEEILTGAVVILGIKNMRLKGRNRRLQKSVNEAHKIVDDVRVQVEALNMFDQFFGKRPR